VLLFAEGLGRNEGRSGWNFAQSTAASVLEMVYAPDLGQGDQVAVLHRHLNGNRWPIGQSSKSQAGLLKRIGYRPVVQMGHVN
jgi:hypothetical protein